MGKIATKRRTAGSSIGRIPHFETIEEEAAFWDTHSTAEFEDEFEPVAEDIRFLVMRGPANKRLTIRLSEDRLAEVDGYARELGVRPAALARLWLFERLYAERRQREQATPPASPSPRQRASGRAKAGR